MDTETARYPIDFESLNKGDNIPTEVVEKWSGKNRHDFKAFQIALMKFREMVEKEMLSISRPVVATIRKDAIRILTDEEAVGYTGDRHDSLRGQMFRNHRRSVSAIDATRLTDTQKRLHETGVINRSKEIQAMRDARRMLAQAHKRDVPGLPEK